MGKKELDVFDSLENYFSLLDLAGVGADSLFLHEEEKEKHESVLMYAFRKYQAARYHFANVKRFNGIETEELANLTNIDWGQIPRATKTTFSLSRTADHYIYELSAFMEAAKSCLDFLATACANYIQGMKADSIKSFIKLIKKDGPKGQPFDTLRDYLPWLEHLRDYRHHLVHRMIITSATGYEIHCLAALTRSMLRPVVVPRSTPAYFPDTRHARMSRNLEEGCSQFDHLYMETKIVGPGKGEVMIDFQWATNLLLLM